MEKSRRAWNFQSGQKASSMTDLIVLWKSIAFLSFHTRPLDQDRIARNNEFDKADQTKIYKGLTLLSWRQAHNRLFHSQSVGQIHRRGKQKKHNHLAQLNSCSPIPGASSATNFAMLCSRLVLRFP